MTELLVLQVLLQHVHDAAPGMIVYIHGNPRLMRGQESPVIKGKTENALARLDRLDLGENDEDVTDVQELVRRENFFMSVASTPPESNLR